ncbi:ATP-dependent DNA helicase RecG [Ruminococcus sp. YE71]|uniref:ATP-dependent DNA helicase RecG n=1 Tax=unclassified Ruminococcus TaxID=2608920 RepID=UPI00088411CD|nr:MULTISPECIES: ATP-dependent DNA helicase RecG [unclassified Ruminococcus]SDA12458.1 ATP-dependent DNA helicase RecG [Ruminococcus sp. YE78]SFW16956.1 ATP-dependent DNA helicase RecG [Ruminococcus sp. YE71]
MNDKLERSIVYVKGVGPKRAELFAKLGVTSVYDLLQYCPRDYVDLSSPVELRGLDNFGEEPVVIRARLVRKMPPAHIRKGMTVLHAVFTDDTDDVTVTMFNTEYLFASLKEGQSYILYGRLGGNIFRREMSSPTIYPADSPDLIQPVYPLTEGLTQNVLRKAVRCALDLISDEVTEIMPPHVCGKLSLCSLITAWENIHFPKSMDSAAEARRRLIFDELFVHALAVAYRRENENSHSNFIMKYCDLDDFAGSLPFKLTNAQQKALDDCVMGMCSPERMNRLIQGDVGSGKTVVAAGAAYFAHKNGYQSCVMAPTEILAGQHYDTFRRLLEPLGVRVGLLKGSLTPKKKKEMQTAISLGEYDVVVGTHALISENVKFFRLALVITDEQHRFGVEQRAALSAKGNDPHRIVMSATPIPRTLALIYYGELAISIIDELPLGRKPISTYAISGRIRSRAYGFVKKQLDDGHQAYIVCPAVEESELDIKDVKSYYEELSAGEFSGYSLGLLHGKMTGAEKDEVMSRFKEGEIQLLVATTVVEVGVDVPNATVIVIENADRFGLSQLHQLRGRVGRGGFESFCILITENATPDVIKRMKLISSTNDGFKIAEEDLKLRGPGDFFGKQQHGLPDFRIADLARDVEVFRQAQIMAERVILSDPTLSHPENKVLKDLALRLIEKGSEMN